MQFFGGPQDKNMVAMDIAASGSNIHSHHVFILRPTKKLHIL